MLNNKDKSFFGQNIIDFTLQLINDDNKLLNYCGTNVRWNHRNL